MKKNRMNIFVTGGCGYIGTLLTQKLLSQGNDVTVMDIMWFGNYLQDHPNLTIIQRDIRNIKDISLEGIDVVIHLANIANDPGSELDSKLTWEVNALATMLLVEVAIEYDVKQLIYASSGSVYGVKSEPDVTEDLSLVPISDYNKTKMISERVLLSYQNSILIQIIRPATVCGISPRMRLDLSVNMLTMQALNNKIITVFGGDQIRPNIHIKDMVSVYIHMLQLGDKASGIFNAGFENISILEIAKRINKFVPSEIEITKSNDPRSYRLNSSKLLSTEFQPEYNIEDAIQEIIIAFKEHSLRDKDIYYNVRGMKEVLSIN